MMVFFGIIAVFLLLVSLVETFSVDTRNIAKQSFWVVAVAMAAVKIMSFL